MGRTRRALDGSAASRRHALEVALYAVSAIATVLALSQSSNMAVAHDAEPWSDSNLTVEQEPEPCTEAPAAVGPRTESLSQVRLL